MNDSVEIKQGSFGYYKQGVYYLYSEGDAWRTQTDEVRTFKTVSHAVAFLRNICKKYPSSGYTVIKPDGSKVLLGKAREDALDESIYGPHVWHKKNVVTLMESRGGSYDIYECEYCHKTEKSHGLAGHSVRSGTCIKNLKEVKK